MCDRADTQNLIPKFLFTPYIILPTRGYLSCVVRDYWEVFLKIYLKGVFQAAMEKRQFQAEGLTS